MQIYGFLLFLLVQICTGAENNETDQTKLFQFGEKRLSEYVTAILDHYKQEEPIGVPVPIPDPMEVPPLSHSVSLGRVHYENVQVRGLSGLEVDRVRADLVEMATETTITIPYLDISGNYSLSTWFSSKAGAFTVNLTGLVVTARGKLGVNEDGGLEAQEIDTSFLHEKVAMDFEELPIASTAGDFLFDSVKPYVMREVNAEIMKQLNEQIRSLPKEFDGDVSPLDQLVIKAREQVGIYYDPFKIEDYNYTGAIFEIRLTHIWLSGLSTFHRDGNVTFEIRNDTVRFDAKMGTKELKGTIHWEVKLLGGARMGTASFAVDYLKVRLVLAQALNTRHHPRLDDVKLDFGNFRTRFDGIGDGFLDQGVHLAANIIPNLLRQQITDVLEVVIKDRVGAVLETVETEQIIRENLSKLDEMQGEAALVADDLF